MVDQKDAGASILILFRHGYFNYNNQLIHVYLFIIKHHYRQEQADKMKIQNTTTRRKFIKSSAALGSLTMLTNSIDAYSSINELLDPVLIDSKKSIIGSYGTWANTLVGGIPEHSFRNSRWSNLESWQSEALQMTKELVSAPPIKSNPKITLEKQYDYDQLIIEELSWQLPYGNPTKALLLKPKNATGPLPAILGLHDHGGNKYFGKRKITRTSDSPHPKMIDHQYIYYGGAAWANEIAKRGYVVLVHDTFTFGSRRVLFKDMVEISWGHCATKGMSDENPEDSNNIDEYNRWASEHEHIMSKSLFCAGTTWPGITLTEDQYALDILSSRDDVDADRIGCAGLSGGGLRTVYLGGMDHRIKCAIGVGFMSTWTDFLLYKAYTHTWMTYAPLLPKYLDFPEILGLRVPLPTMTLNNNEDRLFTLPEMHKASTILDEVFKKAGAADRYKGNFYNGDHKFDLQMQKDAFDWFDKWLK